MSLEGLVDAIDLLSESDPSTCAETESIEVLQRQLARLDAFVTEATAAFDASGNWISGGARNAATWLAARCRIPKSRTRRMIRRGRDLRYLPATSRAWAAGDITGDHVDAIRTVRNEATKEALDRDEAMLMEHASILRYDSFIRALTYWK